MKNFQPICQNGICYRLAVIQDLPTLVNIYNQSIKTRQSTAILQPLSVAEREAWFAEHQHPNRPLIVAENQTGQVVAYGCFSDLYPMFAYHISSEISIYVDSEAKGMGIGTMMLEILLKIAPNYGIHNVIAKIFAHNEPSLNLFRKYDFEQWGYLPKVCDMDGFLADVVILGKDMLK